MLKNEFLNWLSDAALKKRYNLFIDHVNVASVSRAFGFGRRTVYDQKDRPPGSWDVGFVRMLYEISLPGDLVPAVSMAYIITGADGREYLCAQGDPAPGGVVCGEGFVGILAENRKAIVSLANRSDVHILSGDAQVRKVVGVVADVPGARLIKNNQIRSAFDKFWHKAGTKFRLLLIVSMLTIARKLIPGGLHAENFESLCRGCADVAG